MSTPDCPDPDRLLALARGTLPERELDALAGHLEACPRCDERLRALDTLTDPLLEQLRATGESTEDVPPPLLGWLRIAGQSRPAEKIVGRRIGRFELVEKLGAGSFAQVYRAWDTELHRPVALKVPRPGVLGDPDDTKRFLREARSAARLHHPGIVALHEIGQTDDGTCFLVEEFIPGITLGQQLRNGPLAPREAASMLRQLARALEYAHAHGIIHRDLKPANILLGVKSERHPEGESSGADSSLCTLHLALVPKIADFGLAKRDAEEPLTLEGQVLGTPAYMSPEQARGDSHKVDVRSDVYSLGVLLYEMLTGVQPFRGTRRMLLLQVLEDEPTPPRLLADRIPRDLEVITLKCMSKSPAQRYGSASELAADLERFLDGEPIRARPAGWPRRLARWVRKHPLAASLFLAVTLGSAFGLTHLSRLSTELVRSAALESAAQHSEILEAVNSRYSSQVVQRAAAAGVEARADYLRFHGAIPLPATFTIDLGEELARISESGVQVRLYSDYPFLSRKDGGPRDEFEVEAMQKLRATPDRPVYRFETLAGKPVLRYAIARRMGRDCLACHNHHPDSPRKDWREGDVRGVLEIIRPLDRDAERTRQGLRGTFLLMASVAGLLLAVGAGAVVLDQRRKSARATPSVA